MDRISDVERRRIAELVAEGASVWRLHQEINRSRHAIRRAVIALHRPVIGLGGALGDADGVPEAALAVLGGQCLRAAPGAAGAQAAGQLRAQRAPGLHEQRQVEGLAGHAHLRIIAIARRQPARDLR